MGENHEWGLVTEGSRDEARNKCVGEENLRPPTQTLLFGRMKISRSEYHSLRHIGEALWKRESLEERGLGEESLERGLLLQRGPTVEANPIRFGEGDPLDANPIRL